MSLKSRKKENHSGANGHLTLIGIFVAAASIACSAISVIGFTKNAYEKAGKYYENVSPLRETTYNFRVYDPSVEQIPTMREDPSVDKVFEYYLSKVDLGGNHPFTAKAIYSKSVDALDITAYSKSRMIKGNYETKNNSLFVDERLANLTGLNIGSKVEFSLRGATLKFKVGAIFSNNTYYDEPVCFFELTDSIKESLEVKNPLYLKGAMIKAKNRTECANYLKTYIPLGKIMDRENFGTDKEYDDYLDRFYNTDYSGEIYDKDLDYQMLISRDDIKKLNKDADRMVLIGGIVTGILITLISLSLIFTKKYVNTLQKRQITVSTGKLILGYSIITIVGAIIFIAATSIFMNFAIELPLTYATFSSKAIKTAYLATIGYGALLLIDLVALSFVNRSGI